MKILAKFLSYLPMINEINGQITQELIEQEFPFLPMAHSKSRFRLTRAM